MLEHNLTFTYQNVLPRCALIWTKLILRERLNKLTAPTPQRGSATRPNGPADYMWWRGPI